jgi:hypothetical protein
MEADPQILLTMRPRGLEGVERGDKVESKSDLVESLVETRKLKKLGMLVTKVTFCVTPLRPRNTFPTYLYDNRVFIPWVYLTVAGSFNKLRLVLDMPCCSRECPMAASESSPAMIH